MVEDLIRQARRRFLLNLTLAQLAFAAAVGIAGVSLILILGTRYLEWWTLALFAAAGIALGGYRIWREIPDSYATAVRLDENARLCDALSTAIYFGTHTGRSRDAHFFHSQREQAETAARTVNLDEALPFHFPRALYAVAALGLLASGLIGLRYRLYHGLDLRAPITQFFLEDLAARDMKKNQSPPASRRSRQGAESPLADPGKEPAPGDPDALDKAIEEALQNPATSSSKKADSGKTGEEKAGGDSDQSAGDPIEDADRKDADQKDASSQNGSKDGKDSGNANSGKQAGLLSRLKEAVSNMFSKSAADDSSSPQNSGQQQNKSDSQAEKGNPGKDQQQQGDSQADAQDAQNADSQSGRQGQGQQEAKSTNQGSQAGSGIGSKDGSKDIKAAEQLKAMGKISEIIGKRAANVSGEMTVEVQSGSQQLKTQYTDTAARHGEAGSDVTRDEIPLSLQPFVERYFEQIQKSGAGRQPARKTQPSAPPKPTP